MLFLENISLQFGGRSLFKDLSCLINPEDKIGLVGSNGAGKSTLLKIIAGINDSDSGIIHKAKYVTIGYLPQDGIIASGKTLYEEAKTAFAEILNVQKEMQFIEKQMSSLSTDSKEYHEALNSYGQMQHKLQDLDAFKMDAKINKILLGLGFQESDLGRETDEFSGGWQMRIALAKLLLKEPSVLLLDEPTNHLDIESQEWLEDYLQKYQGAIILVSHDRAFLDTICKRTLALVSGRAEEYAGNYSYYEQESALRKDQQKNAYKSQQRQLKQTNEFIDKFRYKATKAKQVQSRIKQLDKVDLIELDDEEEEISFRFPEPKPSGRTVIELIDIHKSFGERKIFENLNHKVERGDRAAIIGVNGAGKSTLAKLLAEVEDFDDGKKITGHNLISSYFAQHQPEELDPDKQVLEIVEEVAPSEMQSKLRNTLAAFLFRGDDVFKKVEVLSGGEKSRLALAKMLLKPANFLIMDEPTNHLDMRSKKVLQEALKHYSGSYLIVSHDRGFLDPIVNKVIEVNKGKVKTYLGNVSDYLYRKRYGEEAPKLTPKNKPEEIKKEEILPLKPSPGGSFGKLKDLRKKAERLEKEINKLESLKEETEFKMADPDFYKLGEEVKSTLEKYKETENKLDEIYLSWNEITEEISRIENKK